MTFCLSRNVNASDYLSESACAPIGASETVVLHHVGKRGRGVVLVAMLVIMVLSAMVAAGMLYRMQAESAASASASDGEQAYQAALSGLQVVLAVMAPTVDETQVAPEIPGLPANINPNVILALADRALWVDNPDLFKDHLVKDDGNNRWYFSIYSFNASDKENVRFGLTDESGKVDINTASEETLLALPNMTPELVDALMDYRDKDEEARNDGAEQDYYDQLPEPYSIKNGPLGTIEEVLLVRGFNASILYGEDANLNSLLEPNEDDGDESFPSDDNDGILNTGLYGNATTKSVSIDLDGDGSPKLDLNRASSTELRDAGISSATASFVNDYRNDGGKFSHPSQLLDMKHVIKGSRSSRGRFGGRSSRGSSGPRPGQTIRSGVTESDMPLIMDKLTTAPGRGLAPQSGLLNVNTATPGALATLPGVDEGLALQIAEARAGLDEEKLRTTAWLLTEGFVEADDYKAIAARLATRGFRFRLRIIGFGVPSGRYRIIEAVIDLAGTKPRLVYMRDISRLGAPFALNPEEQGI